MLREDKAWGRLGRQTYHNGLPFRVGDEDYKWDVSYDAVRAVGGGLRVSVSYSVTDARGEKELLRGSAEVRCDPKKPARFRLASDFRGGELYAELSLRPEGLVDRQPNLVPTLITALGADEPIRSDAFQTLDYLGSDAVPGLVKGLKSGDASVQPLVAQLLGRIVEREPFVRDDVVGPLTRAVRSPDAGVRKEATRALKLAVVGSRRPGPP